MAAAAASLDVGESVRRGPVDAGYFGRCSKALVPGLREGLCRAMVLRTVPVIVYIWSTASAGFGT